MEISEKNLNEKYQSTVLKNALFAEQIHLIGLAHLLAKESFMLRGRGRFAGIVIMRSTLRKIGDWNGYFKYIQIEDRSEDLSFY